MFEWDDSKRESNYQKHHIDFPDIVSIFDDPSHLTRQDKRNNYGEDRFQTMGKIMGIFILVVWTRRQENIRLISARKAHKKEIIEYEKGKR